MKYDFTTVYDRSGHGTLAVDAIGSDPGFAPEKAKDGFDEIPMWVADMSFPVFPGVQEAIRERLSHPFFGYFLPSKEYTQAIVDWQRDRNGMDVPEDAILYENGVLGGVASALHFLCEPGDYVLMNTPLYIGFQGVMHANGLNIAGSPLVMDRDGIYRMDLDDMERRIREKHIHCAIVCSPHNPTGRVWERDELVRMMELFERYQVRVIADEIWSDLLLDHHRHIPVQSVSEYARDNTIALYAPSKTFSLAGLVGSYSITYNALLRDRLHRQAEMTHYNEQNVLSMAALIGAYSAEGRIWTDELLEVLTQNVHYIVEFLCRKVPGISVAMPQGTYMIYPDFTGYLERTGRSFAELKKAIWDVGVAWQDGEMFLNPNTMRINAALPFSRVQESCRRLEEYVFCDR